MSPTVDYQYEQMKSRIMERLHVMKKQEKSTKRRNYFLDLPMKPSAAYIDTKCRTGEAGTICRRFFYSFSMALLTFFNTHYRHDRMDNHSR